MLVTKYSANGNDFIIFHTFIEVDRSELAKELCNRTEGVGADGLIVLLPSSECDFKWQFYNSDGSVAEMCGNGSRAAAHYAFSNGLVNSSSFSFETLAGVISASVAMDMVESQLTSFKVLNEGFTYEGFSCTLLDTGVPHVVVEVDDINMFDLDMARHLRSEYNANVNFVEDGGKFLKVRTYERGVEDETLACGTGMAACFLVKSNYQNGTRVVLPKSNDEITLRLEDEKLYLKGSVKKVFELSI